MTSISCATLSHLTLLTLTSKNPSPTQTIKTFLQGQLTCDLNEISSTQSRPFAHCNQQGRMVTLGRVLAREDGSIFLIIPKDLTRVSIQHLEKYAFFSRVHLQEEQALSVFGLTATTGIPPNFPLQLDEVKTIDGVSFICVQETPCRVLAIAPPCWAPPYPTSIQDPAEWLCEDIKNRIAFLTAETSGQFLPHDIELPGQHGVSFNKGCFLGQEIIARMEHLGKLKKKLEVHIDSDPSPEGEIICQARHPRSGSHYQLILK